MIAPFMLAAFQIAPSAVPPAEGEIVVTASLSPVAAADAPASVTVFDEALIEALGPTLATDLVRLAPGVSVATTGAQGTETVVRIRGAESNHTLVFIDGIAFNDIAAANAARFDALTSGGLGRLELIRGPQSALWGSEALGGVVAMSSPDPLGALPRRGGRGIWQPRQHARVGRGRFGRRDCRPFRHRHLGAERRHRHRRRRRGRSRRLRECDAQPARRRPFRRIRAGRRRPLHPS